MDTDEFIKLLIEDDIEKLDKLYNIYGWKKGMDFIKVYENIKDINNPSVHYILGFMHRIGLGIEQDDAKAFYYYQLSAEKNNSYGQNDLGYMYRNCIGMENDHTKAVYYYQLSVEQGNSFAQNNLGHSYRKGLGVERDYEKAVHYYRLGAEQGNFTAKYNLGYMYWRGLGLKQDCEKAIYYFQLGALKGDEDSIKYLKKISTEWAGYFDYVLKISKENNELRERNKQLEEEIVELKYRPDGIGYLEAKQHFDTIKN